MDRSPKYTIKDEKKKDRDTGHSLESTFSISMYFDSTSKERATEKRV